MDRLSGFTHSLLERAEQQAKQQTAEQKKQKLRCGRCYRLFVSGFGTREIKQDVRVNDQIITLVTDVLCCSCGSGPVDDWF